MSTSPTDCIAPSDVMNDVHVRREGPVGRITLTRADALNALTHEMVLAIEQALLDWQTQDEVALVLVDAAGEKAFCAGGDVTALFRQGSAGDVESGRRFWRDEYRLNALIDSFAKPYVVFMDGIVMGGGIGVSAHGSHRIVTERSMLALPECSIGLVPDIGATHLLSGSPGFSGEFLALSGARFGAGDALYTGFADYHVRAARLPALKAALIESGQVDCIAGFSVEPEPSVLASQASALDDVFGETSLLALLDHLQRHAPDALGKAREKIDRASPLSLQLAFDLVREARRAPGLERALTREYRFVSRAVEESDFLEGVRAALIDRDRKPAWQHRTVSDVPAEFVERFKGEAPGGDLRLTG